MKKYKTINEYLAIIGWSKAEMSAQLDVSVRIVGRWANGQNYTPDAVQEWLDELATAHIKIGQPQGWTKQPVLREVADGY